MWHCAPWAPPLLALVLQTVPEDWSQRWSDSPQGTADVQRGFPKPRQAPSGEEGAVVQGHRVTAQKQLLFPGLGWCQSPFLLLCTFLTSSNSHSSFLPFSFQGWAQLSSHHAITTPLLELFFPPISASRIAACPGCPGCQLSSSLCSQLSFHPSCHSSRADKQPRHPPLQD